MIKINLLDSVTDRSKSVAIVEEKVANPRMQTMLLALVVAGLTVVVLGYDYFSANSAKAAAQKELENQQRINQQMAAVNKEQAELEKKVKEIQARIDTIQKLRASQQGPSQVLASIKERVDSVPAIYLESIEQKDSSLTVKGGSPNEFSVTRFGQSLEFSPGLFNNLSIETERKPVENKENNSNGSTVAVAYEGPKPEIINFTIKCSFSSAGPVAPAAGQQPPQQGQQPPAQAATNAVKNEVSKRD